eukprot:scaffold2.g7460.t1
MLGKADDLSSFGFFQRSTVKEMLAFVARTCARRTQVGQRQTVQHEEYFCHVYNRDGLVGIAFVDKDYPARAGFCVVNKIIEDYLASVGEGWRGATSDREDALPVLEAAVQKFQARGACWAGGRAGEEWRRRGRGLLPCASRAAPRRPTARPAGAEPPPSPCRAPPPPPRARAQDPAAADKLARIQRDLDETKVILHQTIESVLDRGEKLDQLVDKSADLSMASQMFYKQARRANSCCKLM